MRLADTLKLSAIGNKPAAMVLRDLQVKLKSRSAGLTTMTADMLAGGPGSGRHKEMHDELTGRGFQHAKQSLMNLGYGTRHRGVVDHYRNGDHTVYVGRKNAKWSHVPDLSGNPRTEGVGLESMQQHLDRQGVNGRQLTHYEKTTGYPLAMPIKDRTPENHLRNTFPQHFK